MRSRIVGILLSLLWGGIFFLSPTAAFADRAGVNIEAPESAAKGSEITIRVTVTHSGNTSRHHVDWVKIWVNQQELAKWEYGPSNLPEGLPFTREVKYKLDGDVEIKAEANCNLHGGKGPKTVRVRAQ